jgi:putative membrane protein
VARQQQQMMDVVASYCGSPPLPQDWMLRWNLDPVLWLGLAIGAAIALRAPHPRAALGGIGVLAAAFVSPLCALSVALFSARAVHHILIVAIAAPLIAAAFPARRSSALGTALLASVVTLWLWHVPSLYDRALADTAIYWLMQFSLIAAATWFWRELFAAPPMPAILAAILGMAQMGMLGALLTFAPDALYTTHARTTLAWGLGPLADQQLAGLIMWVPGIIPYAVITALIGRRFWMRTAIAA